jgi:outer membrane lipoprotein-sorting protein
MNVFRRLSTRGLATLIAAVAVTAALAAFAAVTAFGGGGATPAAEPLAQAVHDALAAPPVDGVTARISFENHLLASSALGSLGGVASPLLSGASGRLWATSDGHFRLELQSDLGDVQVVSDGSTLTVYDPTSNTAYQVALPAQSAPAATDQAPTVPQIDSALARLAGFADVSSASHDSVAGRPAYTVNVSPKANGGLVGGAELSWDAATGVPLHFAIFAKGDSSPVLDLTATDISLGSVASSDVNITPPSDAKVVTLDLSSGSTQSPASTTPVTGFDPVAAAVPFKLVAPDTLDGLARNEVRLTGSGADAGALVTYGEGLGTIVVDERAAGQRARGPLDQLPSVSVGGATGHELSTALGTVLAVTSGGVSYTVAGSVSQADAEAAARALTS